MTAGRFFYDLRYATDHFPGIGTHAFHLLRALLELPGDEAWDVLWNPGLPNTRFDVAEFRRHPRVRWIENPAPALSLTTPLSTGAIVRRQAPRAFFSPYLLMPHRPGCPAVVTLHDVAPLRVPHATSALGRLLFGAALRRLKAASAVVTSSEFSRAEIARVVDLPAGRLRVVRSGTPPAAAPPRRPPSLPEGPFALAVAINKPHKNLETLIAAWKGLDVAAALRLACAGPEDARHPSVAALARRHAAPGVVALGRVTEQELQWLYGHATLVLFPSLYEGFGYPLVEAFAAGTPAVASDIPALREIGDGAARFVEPRDPGAWRAAVVALAADGATRAAMAEAGRLRAAGLTFARAATQVLEIVREAAASG